jgi:heptaprenylglyceryl phosphate synthase
MALRTKQVTVGTAVVSVLEPQTNQTRVIIHNAEKSSNEFIWIGGSNAVTTSTGFHLDPMQTIEFVLDTGNQIWAITDKPGKSLHVLWQVL